MRTIALATLAALAGQQAQGQDIKASSIPRSVTVTLRTPAAAERFPILVQRLLANRLLRTVPRPSSSIGDFPVTEHRPISTTLPPALNSLLCELNPHVCSLKAGQPEWSLAAAPPRLDTASYRCGGTDLPPYVVCVPDLKVYPFSTLTNVLYDASQNKLAEIVHRLGGCEAWDDKCKGAVSFRNPGLDLKSRHFKGCISVPSRAYNLVIPVDSASDVQRVAATLDGFRQENALPLDECAKTAGEMQIMLSVPPNTLSYDDADGPPNSSETSYLQALERMGFPRDAIYSPPKKWSRTHVGIWDRHVDDKHCDLVKALDLNQELNVDPTDPPQPEVAANCLTVVNGIRSTKWDHGTFVAGMVGARLNGVGIVGVNPWCRLWAYEIRADRLQRDGDPINSLTENDDTSGLLPTVINMSFSEESPEYQSALETLIKTYERSILFVAAAGKGLGDVEGPEQCKTSPACLSINPRVKNFLSVVALDSTGSDRLPDESAGEPPNYGPVFDVAAIGDVVGPFHGNVFGRMTGTSVAAPFVTGLASLIQAKEVARRPPPAIVKHRILYTADFTSQLDEIVHFGRINYTRALNTANDQWALKPIAGAAALPTARCMPQADLHIDSATLNGENTGPMVIRAGALRRIVTTDDRDLESPAWLVYLEAGELKKLTDVTFSAGAKLVIRENNGTRDVAAQNIKDYTPCMSW